jgi:phosphonopyruvate decarboxylase
MIKNQDAARIIDEHRQDGIIVATMNAGNVNFGLAAVSQNQELDPLSKASSMGLGVALAQPDRKVIVLDGDGSLLMNLGTLVTIGNKAPENLYHFVFDNGVYAVTGGQPTPLEGSGNYVEMASGAGYAAVYDFEDTEDLATGIDQALNDKGPVFIRLRIEPEIENTPVQFRKRATRNTTSAARELRQRFAG